ncbi:MAG: GTP-binding protein [Firmicutes bacterium]|nr:GTP-binding protein [Bacillota bacterium]
MLELNNGGDFREDMAIVIVGHVDHGKSTIVGRLLADTGSLPQGKLELVKEICRRNSKPFEYAFLLDALKDEQSQGITINAARCFFKTPKRNYILIDAPGHVEFLKNMVTGAARAEAALLVIDAQEGVKENSRRHAYLLSMLGVEQVAVLINKMDLVQYDQQVFENVREEYHDFLNQIGIRPAAFLPVSGREGDNIAYPSERMSWYQGPTVLGVLDAFQAGKPPVEKPFRMPVQGVYKFTSGGDSRRIIAGTVETGRLQVGDEVVFYPSGKRGTVRSIEAFGGVATGNEGFLGEPVTSVEAGYATGFTLNEQIYVTRGEIASISGQTRPQVASRLRVKIFWLGKNPMVYGKRYMLKLGTARVGAKLVEIIKVLDAVSLNINRGEEIQRHNAAECILQLERGIAFDLAQEMPFTGRFVLVDNYDIAGGGIIQEAAEDELAAARAEVWSRNYNWQTSIIPREDRIREYNQEPILILITGGKDVGKKPIAKILERRFFDRGKFVYFLGIVNLLYGVDADIKRPGYNHREEHLRRLGEAAYLMLEAGMILIVTARELTQSDLDLIKTIVSPSRVEAIWVGPEISTDIAVDFHLERFSSHEAGAEMIEDYLLKKGVLQGFN